MRKHLGLLAATAAMLGMSAATNASSVSSTSVEKELDTKQAALLPEAIEIVNTHRLPIAHVPMGYPTGMGPKEWGQYLQRTGRQKWTKKLRK